MITEGISAPNKYLRSRSRQAFIQLRNKLFTFCGTRIFVKLVTEPVIELSSESLHQSGPSFKPINSSRSILMSPLVYAWIFRLNVCIHLSCISYVLHAPAIPSLWFHILILNSRYSTYYKSHPHQLCSTPLSHRSPSVPNIILSNTLRSILHPFCCPLMRDQV